MGVKGQTMDTSCMCAGGVELMVGSRAVVQGVWKWAPVGACGACWAGTAPGGHTEPVGATVPRLLRPAQLSQRRCLSIISFAWCSCEQRLTILQSAFCGCCMREGDVPTYENTRESQHVSTINLYACAHRVSLSSICDTRKWSQHNICKPSDKLALW